VTRRQIKILIQAIGEQGYSQNVI